MSATSAPIATSAHSHYTRRSSHGSASSSHGHPYLHPNSQSSSPKAGSRVLGSNGGGGVGSFQGGSHDLKRHMYRSPLARATNSASDDGDDDNVSDADLDDSNKVTPNDLAQHLPMILNVHGAMPIRRITHHLYALVPAYAQLPPGRQRRFVVKALESRPAEFRKIGWGTWTSTTPSGASANIRPEAHTDGDISAEQAAEMMMGIFSPMALPYDAASDDEDGDMAIDDDDELDIGETLLHFKQFGGTSESKPSITTSTTALPQNKDELSTDEEDWKALGPTSLRSRLSSLPSPMMRPTLDDNSTTTHSTPPTSSTMAITANPSNIRKESFGVGSLDSRLNSLKVGGGGGGGGGVNGSSSFSTSPASPYLHPHAQQQQQQQQHHQPPVRSIKSEGHHAPLSSGGGSEKDAIAALVQLSSSNPAVS